MTEKSRAAAAATDVVAARGRGKTDGTRRTPAAAVARRRGVVSRLMLAGAAALAAQAAHRTVANAPFAAALRRTNFRGRTVTLAAGPALAVSAATVGALGSSGAATAGASAVAGIGCGAVGLYDDVVGARADQRSAKGFAGHLGALRAGRMTSGIVKIIGIGASGLAAAALLAAAPTGRPRPRGTLGRAADLMLGAGVIAGTANLVNLLDLRPGRALKAALLLGTPLLYGPYGGLAAGPLGAAAGLLPADLDERAMLGDCGANALGGQLGVALAARTGPLGRAGLLAGIAALTAASEKVSFSQVIRDTPGLRELDALGRRSDPFAEPPVSPDAPATSG